MSDETKIVKDNPKAFKIVHGYNPGDEPKKTQRIVFLKNDDGSTSQYTLEEAQAKMRELENFKKNLEGDTKE